MRMPLSEFLTQGDLKFLIAFFGLMALAIFHFTQKFIRSNQENQIEKYNQYIHSAGIWALVLGVFSLLLGLLHSCYFMGQATAVSPQLLFQGFSYTLITPILGLIIYMICRILKGIGNKVTSS